MLQILGIELSTATHTRRLNDERIPERQSMKLLQVYRGQDELQIRAYQIEAAELLYPPSRE